MSQRKTWTVAQDQLLKDLMTRSELGHPNKYKWGQIAQFINRNENHRTGKQCRQRWHNQLKPGIDNQRQWTTSEEEILFSKQEQMGNKWAQIAKELPGRTDNNIKNYFYSTLRKALRKVNSYITLHKKEQTYKNVKKLKQQTLNKVLSVAQQKYQNKINLKTSKVLNDAQEIKKMLIYIQRDDKIIPTGQYNDALVNTIDKILEFNRNCKRRKGKKKDSEEEHQESEEQFGEEQMEYCENLYPEKNKGRVKEQKSVTYKQSNKPKKQKFPEKKQKKILEEEFKNDLPVVQNQKKDSSLISSNNLFRQSVVFVSNSSSSKDKNSVLGMSHSFQKYYPIQFDASHQYFNSFVGTHDQGGFISKMPIIQKRETIKSGDNQDPNLFWREDSIIPSGNLLNPFEISQGYNINMNDNPMMVSLNASGFLQRKGSNRLQKAQLNP